MRAAIAVAILIATVARGWAAPSEGRDRLGAFVGSWKIHVRYWPVAGFPAQEGEGTSDIRWVLGGRYIEQRQEARLMGKPMSGIGYIGFDDLRRRFVSVWLDDMSAAILETSGSTDGPGKSIKTRGTIEDERTGKAMRFEDAMTPLGRDKFVYEAWTSGPDDQAAHRVMEIVYVRR